jgi:predicted alpha/beta hydrolase
VKIELTFTDGTTNSLSWFKAKQEQAPAIVLFPALGVRASFYKHLGQQLADTGIHCITADWRGFGASNAKISRNHNHGYKELIQDIRQILDKVKEQVPASKIYLLGHSLGGQLGALYNSRYPGTVDGIVLVASCLVHYKEWGDRAWQIKLAGRVFPMISNLMGYFPGHRLGFAGKEAKGVMKDWCHNALSGKYEPVGDDFDYETALKEMTVPVLSLSFEKDTMAVQQACRALYNKFSPDTAVKHLHLKEADTSLRPLDHYAWARKPEFIAPLIKNWIVEEI